jgi:hypothetical protein
VDDLLTSVGQNSSPHLRNRRERRIMAAGYTVSEFCEHFRISHSHFYAQQRLGVGPKTMKIGRRRLISPEAAAEYRQRLEMASGA